METSKFGVSSTLQFFCSENSFHVKKKLHPINKRVNFIFFLKRNRKTKKDSATSARYFKHEEKLADNDTATIEVGPYGARFGNEAFFNPIC